LCCFGIFIYVRFNSSICDNSFADFFYAEDGSIGFGFRVLIDLVVIIGLFGVYMFRKKQNQCSINPKRKKKNLVLRTIATSVLGFAVFLSLEKLLS
jgi:hypothetical protein